MLRNECGALPLDLPELRRVAVIGPNALYPAIQGGGSAGVTAVGVVSPADGLRAALATRAEVVTAAGCRTQVYLAEPSQPDDHGRPLRALATFSVVRAAAGQRAVARLTIPSRAFARYDQDLAS